MLFQTHKGWKNSSSAELYYKKNIRSSLHNKKMKLDENVDLSI